MSETTNSAAAQEHVADTRPRRKRAWRLFWSVFTAFGVLLLAIPAVGYLIWQAHGRQLLRDEVDAIVAKGEPLTTAELLAWHHVPEGERDITPIWIAALEPFSGHGDYDRYQNIPIVGSAQEPPLDQPWDDPQAIADYLSQHKQHLTALHAAARERGVVYYPYDFKTLALPDSVSMTNVRPAIRTLSLELHQHLRQKNLEAALQGIDTQLALIHTLEHEPYMVSLWLRIGCRSLVLNEIQKTVGALPMSDEQLAHLQNGVRGLRLEEQFPTAMISERAYIFQAFHYQLDANGDFSPGQENLEIETTHDISRIRRPEDCAQSLALHAELIAASRLPMPAALNAAAKLDESIRAQFGSDYISR